jgi:hypothetical protein
MYNHLTSQIPELQKKFQSLGGSDGVLTKTRVFSGIEGLTKGDKLKYIGPKKNLQGDWEITSDPKFVEVILRKDTYKWKGPLKSFLLSNDFEIVGKTTEVKHLNFSYQLEKIKGYKTDNWLPTQYASTNYSEWFAESITLYMFDSLEGDIKKYFSEIIKKV